MGIADGQHRVSAFLKAWEAGSKEPMRVIFEDYPLDANERMSVIARMNGTNKNWGVSDHQHRLLAENNINMAECVIQFLAFIEVFQIIV